MDLLARDLLPESLAGEPKVQRVRVVLSFVLEIPLEEFNSIGVLEEHMEGLCPSKTRRWGGILAASGSTAASSEVGLLLFKAQGCRRVHVGVRRSMACAANL